MDRSISTRDRGERAAGRRPSGGLLLGLVWLVGLSTVYAVAQAPGDDPTSDQNGDVQVLTRGPVHEAFAVPVVNDATPGLVIPKTPPAPVEELPPDQKPAGPNVQWMSGYWSWDQSRDDFVWISGIWREPPPGRQWVPGYWNQVERGFQWIPGAWIPVGQAGQQVDDQDSAVAQGQAAYLPAPPASLEIGPNIPSPSSNVFWSPGCWYWQQSRYVWRTGFWAAVQPTWVWVPAHYVWTPGGYLFVEGYWDLPLVDRGILFAPVYYAQPVYLRPAYVYTPTITIATPGLVANLFVQPSYNHYCFGDYYDRTFLTAGIFPWFSFTYASGPRPPAYYDPLFTFYASVNVRTNPGWATRCREDYVLRRDNIGMRPPRTYIEQTRIVQNNINITKNVTVINQGGRPGPAAQMLGRPITQVAARQAEPGGPRMEHVNAESRRQWQNRSQQLAQFRTERAGREVAAAPRRGPGGPGSAAGAMRATPAAAQAQNQAQAQTRPRPFAMPNSPVAAPIGDRGQARQAGGPVRRPEHQAPLTGAGPRPMPRHLDQQAAQARPAAPTPGRTEARPAPVRPDRQPIARAERPQPQIRAEAPIARPERPQMRAEAPIARPERPQMRAEAPIARPERPQMRQEAPIARPERAALPRHAMNPGAAQPGIAHLRNQANPGAARPPMAATATGSPLAPRHLRGGPAQAPSQSPQASPNPRLHAPSQFVPRRPPPLPRPMGPAQRRQQQQAEQKP